MYNSQDRDKAIDICKALAIFFVLCWHLQPFNVTVQADSSTARKFLWIGINQFYEHISLTAVPLFLIASLYLLVGNLEKFGIQYFRKRIIKLSSIFLCLFFCQIIIYYLSTALLNPGSLNNINIFSFHDFGISILYLFMKGGPSLPHVGDSVFYFHFVLIILSIISAFFYIARGSFEWNVLVALFMLNIIYFLISFFLIEDKIPYWRIDNFLVYIPVVFMAKKIKNYHLPLAASVLFILYIASILSETFLLKNTTYLFLYSRLSIVFWSIFLFLFIKLKFSSINNVPGYILFLSYNSLVIYAIHKYWLLFIISSTGVITSMLTGTTHHGSYNLLHAFLCILLTISTTHLARHVNFKVMSFS